MRLSALRTAAACVLVLSGCSEKILSPGGIGASVVLAPPEGTFLVGDTLRLVATVLDADGTVLTYRNIEWASSDPSIATVSAGLVTGVRRGRVTIYAAAEAFADSALLTVVQPFKVVGVVVGNGSSCAVTTEEEAFCWGSDADGLLGNGTTHGGSRRPSLVDGGLLWASVTIAESFACGLTSAGAAFCWGSNYAGAFGQYQPSYSEVPLALPVAAPVATVVAGAEHSCVLSGGSTQCWGF